MQSPITEFERMEKKPGDAMGTAIGHVGQAAKETVEQVVKGVVKSEKKVAEAIKSAIESPKGQKEKEEEAVKIKSQKAEDKASSSTKMEGNLTDTAKIVKDSDKALEATGVEEHCWIQMPTGCGQPLIETTTPAKWFQDSRNPKSCRPGRLAEFNTWCGKTDAKHCWGTVAPATGVEEYCFIQMPTGCGQPLTETTTPTKWFQDSRSPCSCQPKRLAEFNKWCGKTDAKHSWGTVAFHQELSASPAAARLASAVLFAVVAAAVA